MKPALVIAAGVVLAAASACSGVDLLRRSDIPGMASLHQDLDQLQRRVEHIEVPDRDGPLRIAVEEVTDRGLHGSQGLEDRDADRPLVVLLHGVLSNRQAWSYVTGALGEEYDLLLVDLPGCGDSDKPDPDSTREDLYSPAWIAEKVLLALERYRRARDDTRRLALVGHSLGGTVILHMLGDSDLRARFPELVAAVDRAVLVAAVDVIGVPTSDPTFVEIAQTTGFEIAFARLFGILRSRTVRSVHDGSDNPLTMPYEEAERLYRILDDTNTRGPGQAMITQMDQFSAGNIEDWAAIEEMIEQRANIQVPSLIIWGERDRSFSVSMGHLLRDSLPNAFLRTIPRSMHSLPAERPRILALLIDRFLQDDAGHLAASWDRILGLPEAWVEASDARKLGAITEAEWADAVYRQ